MTFAFVFSSVFEVSQASLAVVATLGAIVVAFGITALVRAYFLLVKKRRIALQKYLAVEKELQLEHLSQSSELTVRRKGTTETITLPQHYTPQAADELLEMLTH